MAARKGDARDSLLNAAESLFAEHGYEATTTRQIASLSGNTLGTLSYHFGSKQSLLKAILERRFAGVAERRLACYEAMIASDGKVTPAGVVRAIMQPFVDLGLSGDDGWKNYVTLLGRIRDSGNREQREFFTDFARPYVKQCMDWLREAAPGASESQLAYSYDLCTTLAVQFSGGPARRRLANLSQAEDEDCEAHRERLILFANAGVRALLGADV